MESVGSDLTLSLFSLWAASCRVSVVRLVNILWQLWKRHVYGRLPVWIRRCRARELESAKCWISLAEIHKTVKHKPCHTFHTYVASLPYEFLYVLSMLIFVWSLYHNSASHIYVVSCRYEYVLYLLVIWHFERIGSHHVEQGHCVEQKLYRNRYCCIWSFWQLLILSLGSPDHYLYNWLDWLDWYCSASLDVVFDRLESNL